MKYLLFNEGELHKANLHSHSTCSDGRFTPEELKEMYKEKGYSVFAFTDHGSLHPQDHLSDDEFLALNGLEIGLSSQPNKEAPDYITRKNCDIGLIAPAGVTEKFDYRPIIKANTPEGYPNYNPALVRDIMHKFRELGYFVTHNHPDWSMERYPDYKHYHGMHALEIINYGCVVTGVAEHNEHVYQQMLERGERIYCIACDDNHNKVGRLDDSFGAWTMIKSKEFTYESIMEALFAGSFYASEGPDFKAIYVDDDNVLHVETSPVQHIRITTGNRQRKLEAHIDKTHMVTFEESPVKHAIMKLTPEMKFVRITILDDNGKYAYSNAYFMDEILG